MRKYVVISIIIIVFGVLISCSSSSDEGNGVVYSATGELDGDFDPGTGPNDMVYSIVAQKDGKIIIAGSFTTVNGTGRNRIARLNADGSLDTSFNPGTGANNHIYSAALDPNGKIIIGGEFTSYNGTTRNYIARINTDGSLDTAFDPGTGGFWVTTVDVQTDGKPVVGGYFTSFNGTSRNHIVRLNTNGSVDTGFDPGTGTDGFLQTVSVQGDGKIFICGGFFNYNDTPRDCIALVNSDGSLNTGFNSASGANNTVSTFKVQKDGKVVIGGSFTLYDGTARNHIARLNTDGSLDTSFDPGTGVSDVFYGTAIDAAGKILIAGGFTSYNGTDRNYIARVNTDGSLDTDFDPGTGASTYIMTIVVLADGKLIIGGLFSSYNGTPINKIARIK
jgi:uncharacterized delta-60 repeat protein